MIRSGRLSRITRTGFTLANRSRVDHRGSIEALSTMNDAKGVMARLIAQGIRIRKEEEEGEKRGERERRRQFFTVSLVRVLHERVYLSICQHEMLCDPRAAAKAQNAVTVRLY